MQDSRTLIDNRRWLRRVIEDETHSAWLLLVAAIAGLSLAQLWPGLSTFLADAQIGGVNFSITHFAADGLLAVFFFVAGLELRHELTVGSLNTVRQAAVPLVAAAGGMIVPAVLFLSIAAPELDGAWGVPMATDLPIALVLVSAFGRHLPLALRAFLLSLAIADDAASVLVVAVAFGSDLNAVALIATALALFGYWALNRRQKLWWFQLSAALGAWVAMFNSGVHPTLVGLLLGLLTIESGDRYREKWQPISSGVCVPLFVFTALAIPLNIQSISFDAITAVFTARALGKPLGIALGVAIALVIFRPRERMPWPLYVTAGLVASAGFSVSLLFAQLSITSSDLLAQVQIAVVASLVASAMLSAVALKFVRIT